MRLRHAERALEAVVQLVEDAYALDRLRGRLDGYRREVGSRFETDTEVLDRLLGPVNATAAPVPGDAP